MRYALIAATCAALFSSLAIATAPTQADDSRLPPPPPPGAEKPLPPPSLGMMLKRVLPALKLDSKQDALWVKAEQADASNQIEAGHAMMRAQMTLREKLADGKTSLSDAFRSLESARKVPPQPSPAWLAFFDSLSAEQGKLVRQALLAPPPGKPHGQPGDAPQGDDHPPQAPR